MNEEVTILMDGRTCVGGVPLSDENQVKLADLLRVEIRSELDAVIVYELSKLEGKV